MSRHGKKAEVAYIARLRSLAAGKRWTVAERAEFARIADAWEKAIASSKTKS